MKANPRPTLWTRLFSVRDRYSDPLDKGVAQGVLVVAWMILGVSVFFTGFLAVFGLSSPQPLFLPIVGIVLSISVFVVLRRGELQAASRLLVILAALVSGIYIVATDDVNRLLTAIVPIALAGVLLNRGGIILTGVWLVVLSVLDTLLRFDLATTQVGVVLVETFTVAIILVITVSIQAVFVGRQRLIAEQSLSATEDLRRVLEATEDIDLGMSQGDVLSSMIRLFRRSYQFDSVQVYLADSEGRLNQLVRAGLRRTEIIDLEGDEVLTPGDVHPISDAARFRDPIQVTLSDTPSRRDYFMPAIQQGVALPLVDGDKLLGVVDIQSTVAEPFSEEQIRTMALIAGSFATLANLLQANELLERSLREQEVVASRAQAQLASEQAQRRELVTNIWSEYIDQRGEGVVGFDVDKAQNQVKRAADMPDEMREALAKRGEHLRVTDKEKILSVPILLRGETLGAMSFALPLDHVITERQVELAKTIALRLGSALENTRLLEQTRLRAARERKATEISTLLFGANDVESLLKLAADNFNDTLGAIQTRIFVEPGKLTEPHPPPATNGANGHNPNGDPA